ncbi:MAG: succinate dehydrogenase, cytochrome b556 subunit [Aggregatilineales bacterium]
MTSLALTITETLRYRGKLGQWSWALHRISGLGTLIFLFLHIIDTSWAVFAPNLYTEAIRDYQSPLFTFGEFVLVACVVYHALNGFRIILFDWRPQWWKYQARAATYVLVGTLVVLVPTFVLMFGEALRHYTQDISNFGIDTFRIPQIVSDNLIFVIAIVGVLIFGLVASVVYSLVPGANAPKTTRKQSRFDTFMWTYMRVSGVIILPLVLGHVGMMHVIQGVFHITTAGYTPVGTTAINQTGTAVEFVSQRWNTMFAGVFIWRIYDILMVLFVCVHGFYGLHYVMNDYVHNKLVNRGFQIAIALTAIGLMILGGTAILQTIPVDTVHMLEQAAVQTAQLIK